MKGTFISIWDDGVSIRTNAILNTETGEVIAESVEAGNVEELGREFFESSEFFNSGEEFEVCPKCHEFILKVVIKEGNEALVCSNPYCGEMYISNT